jgi:Fe-S-cluster containining protein
MTENGDSGGFGETVQVDFALAVGEGRLDASVVVPAGKVTLTQIMPAIQGLTSNIVGSVVQIVQSEGRQISCKAGCGACCRQMVPLSIFEAEALAQWIATLPEEHQEELRQRFHAALLALKESGILDRMDPAQWVDGSEDAKTLAIDYFAAGVACPFLENESCGIHPIRPLICREYLVTSPPEFCAHPTVDKVAGVPMPLKPSQSLFRLGAQIEKGGRGWIPLVFLFAWIKSGAQPGERFSGSGPDVLYEFVRNLTSQ